MTKPAVRYLAPPGAITPTGPWSLASLDTATNTLYIAGMRGIDPMTNDDDIFEVEGTFHVPPERPSLVSLLMSIPEPLDVERDQTPMRDVDL